MNLIKNTPLIGAAICALTVACFFFLPNQSKVQIQNSNRNLPVSNEQTTTPESTASERKTYKEVIAKIDAERTTLASKYQQSNTQAKKDAVINNARNVITQSIATELFPFWYGTDWDFYGNTETPNQGKIACGYFVSTLLRDVGWKVERVRLAQQASENIILSLTKEPYIKRFSRVAIEDFVKAVKELGEGLYVVGLDIHTGFIINTGDEVYFIHSSYVEPYKVVKERAIESRILSSSKYRVIGKLSADNQLITKWFFKNAIVTRAR